MFDVPTSEKYSIGKTLPKKEIKHLLWQLGSFPFILFGVGARADFSKFYLIYLSTTNFELFKDVLPL